MYFTLNCFNGLTARISMLKYCNNAGGNNKKGPEFSSSRSNYLFGSFSS